MKIPIKQINIGERQRTELGDLTDLDSMAELGQLQAIGLRRVDDKWELVFGRRRLLKAEQLGWTEIEAVDLGQLSELQKQEMELVEDLGRKDRTWKEKALAVAKLFRLKKSEKLEVGETWTIRMMAAFTNESKTQVGYMLQVADEIARDPEGPVATAVDYLASVKALVRKHEGEVTAELEKRRQAVVTTPGPVPQEDTTVPQDKVQVRLHGRLLDFADAIAGEDFGTESFHCVLGYNITPNLFPNVVDALRKDGYAVLWFDNYELWNASANIFQKHMGVEVQPHPLIWGKLRQTESLFRFCPNYACGLVVTPKREQPALAKNSCTLVIPAEPDELPYPVIDFSLDDAPVNMPVLLVGGVPAVAVAETGRTPIFFEPNEARLQREFTALTEHYQNTIPNVELLQ